MRYLKAQEIDQKERIKLKKLTDKLVHKDEFSSSDLEKLNDLIKKSQKEIDENAEDLKKVTPFENECNFLFLFIKKGIDEDGDKFLEEACPFSNPLTTNSLIIN
jgi:hypothetical protein